MIAVAKSADSDGELNNHEDPDSMFGEAVDGHSEHLLQSSDSRVRKIMFNNYVPFVLTINVLYYF